MGAREKIGFGGGLVGWLSVVSGEWLRSLVLIRGLPALVRMGIGLAGSMQETRVDVDQLSE